ncbi:MAG: DUF2508 family protein [Oscillospiraceae bacterium]
MELALQSMPFKLYKVEDRAKPAQNKLGSIAKELRDCVEAMKQNEALFNMEYEPELIDASIYERQALICKYHFLLREAKLKAKAG